MAKRKDVDTEQNLDVESIQDLDTAEDVEETTQDTEEVAPEEQPQEEQPSEEEKVESEDIVIEVKANIHTKINGEYVSAGELIEIRDYDTYDRLVENGVIQDIEE